MGGDDHVKPEHLCVFIHGLWGNPSHMKQLCKTLQSHHGKEKILTLICESNSGNLTYDGVDVCAERAAQEIKTHVQNLKKSGHQIIKFSLVGYSLGGLIARYVIGILDHEDFFSTVNPVNFTTFASPHLGTRTPLTLWTSQIYNSVGPSLISLTGQQLFLMDRFRDSGKPLLEIMADPDSIFIHALKKFPKRTLYANIINDRLAPFYTTAISSTDPYANSDLSKLDFNYIEGYDPVIIDGNDPIKPKSTTIASTALIPTTGRSAYILQTAQNTGLQIGTIFIRTFLVPIFLTGFLANTAIESYRSQRRIYLHTSSASRAELPHLLLQQMATEKASMLSRLPPVLASDADRKREDTLTTPSPTSLSNPEHQHEPETLALLPNQFTMLSHLNNNTTTTDRSSSNDDDDDAPLFTKFHVHIRNTRFSHAAMVVRRKSSWFDEGRTVSRHWVERRFDL